jgi:hypothetical protein
MLADNIRETFRCKIKKETQLICKTTHLKEFKEGKKNNIEKTKKKLEG